MTIKEIIAHINKCECNDNANVLRTMLRELQESDNPDLSGITATAATILAGYKSVDTEGNEVVGLCPFNAELPNIPEGASFVSIDDIPDGKCAIVRVDGTWTLLQK